MAKVKVTFFRVLFLTCFMLNGSVDSKFVNRDSQEIKSIYGTKSEKIIHRVEASNFMIPEGVFSEFISHDKEIHNRQRRQAGIDTSDFAHTSDLHDTHYQLLVHWVGEGSDMIIALARNRTANPTSTVYISKNYGGSFSSKALNISSNQSAVIDQFFVSPVSNTHYIFADVVHKLIFTTTNTGNTFYKITVPFIPKKISFHPTQRNYVLGYDEDDPEKRLWKSSDFGDSWELFKLNVKSFYWGSAEYSDGADVVYVHRQNGGSSYILKADFVREFSEQRLLSQVHSFQIHDNYMFATRNLSGKLELWVSYNRGDFQKAQFPNNLTHSDYFIVDASEGQVFVCVNHEESNSHLYVSDARGLQYSLSLENIFYFNPHGANNASWLKYVSEKSFADVHKVEGLRGIYIANRFYNASSIDNNHQRTAITYNKGATWGSIEPPQNDSLGRPTNCTYYSWYDYYYGYTTGACSLHLTQRLNMYDPSTRNNPILSKKSAPGLIMGTGKLNASLDAGTDYNVYLSRDGGLEWKEVLKGPYHYAFGDHGGVILAVKQYTLTGEFLYSWDEGQTWLTYKFTDEKLHIYGILTEPGEQTTIFFLFGSKPGPHNWMTVKVDLKGVFNNKVCGDSDYKQWSPTDNPRVDCLMGRRMVYERRRENSLCYNGRDYDRPLSSVNCTCSSEDFECDVGFEKQYSWSSTCEPDSSHNRSTHSIPRPCPEGTTYTRTKGYRKIAGNTCEGGIEYTRKPDVLFCPVEAQEDFLLYSTRSSVHRYMFSSQMDEVLPLSGVKDIVALDYDYKNNCLYFADTELDTIQRLCLGVNDSADDRQETLIGERLDSVEGLAYDWMSHNIYWVDAGSTPKIEVARADGTHRRLLINHRQGNKTILSKPRAIALAPSHGVMFWTDWDDENPRIMKASMDGRNITTIVSHYWVHWPNGVAVDSHREKIYWTDAYLNKIYSCDFNGSDKNVLLSYTSLLKHPYAITIYKDSMYWSDWTNHAIMVADKYQGNLAGPFISNLSRVTDIKVLHTASQQGSSACSSARGHCQSLCTERLLPGLVAGGRTCLCSDMFKGFISTYIVNNTYNERCSCEDNLPLDSEGFCVSTVNVTCASDQFPCGSGNRCIPRIWRCDRDNDCGDFSDELGCNYQSCDHTEFTCKNGRCIPARWRCDHDDDCGDYSDEDSCSTDYPSCSSDQLECNNGRCVSLMWKCDGENDCHDNTDEIGCNTTTTTARYDTTCSGGQFGCVSGSIHCISNNWKCDGYNDCDDGSDEQGCRNSSSCNAGQFTCNNGQCIDMLWKCDNMADCQTGEDEKNCSGLTTYSPPTYAPESCDSWMSFNCGNGSCVSLWDVCDGHQDCASGRDESGCQMTTVRPWLTSVAPSSCGSEQYTCEGGNCVYLAWVCDGDRDCPNGDDETGCNKSVSCGPKEIECLFSGGCIPISAQCDGTNDCFDGTDEKGCGTIAVPTTPPVHCGRLEFDCGEGQCISLEEVCDGKAQCWNYQDENRTLCTHRVIDYSVREYSAELTEGDTNVAITWSGIIPSDNCSTYQVEVMVQLQNGSWYNWTMDSSNHTLRLSLPFSDFSYTAGVICMGHSSPPGPLKQMTGLTLVPVNVSWVGTSTPSIRVTWDMYPSDQLNQFVVHYNEMAGPEVRSQMSNYVSKLHSHSHYQVELTQVQVGATYSVYVVAVMNDGEEKRSKAITKILEKTGCEVAYESISIQDTSLTVQYSVSMPHTDQIRAIHLVLTSRATLSRHFNDHSNGKKPEKKDGKYKGSITAGGLSPGVEYNLQLSVLNNNKEDMHCEDAVQRRTTTGSPMPEQVITHASLGTDKDSILLQWADKMGEKPTKDQKYTVYYTATAQLLEEVNLTTVAYGPGVTSVPHVAARQLELRHLQPCEDYYFRVQVTAPHRGLLSAVFTARTSIDDDSPPKHVRVDVRRPQSGLPAKRDLHVKFHAACREMQPQTYMVLIEDEVTRSVSAKQLNATDNRKIEVTLKDVDRSAEYKISVKTATSRKSIPVLVHVDPYPAPQDFHVSPLDEEDSLTLGGYISWQPPADKPQNSNLTYVVYHAECKDGALDPHYSKLTSTRNTYYMATNLKPSVDHCFRVRLQLDNGYHGHFTHMEVLPSWSLEKLKGLPSNTAAPSDGSGSSLGVATVVGIVVPCVLLVLIVVAILALYIHRHRRLQQSFLSYARSHYDTTTDRTTFSNPEEEEPMINGFAEDEPLVLG